MATDPVASEVPSVEDVLGVGRGSDILVVVDDDRDLAAYASALAPLGRKAAHARSGSDELAKLLAQDFALVVVDASLAAELETARLIRTIPRHRGLPILLLAPAWTNDAMAEAYANGAYDFVAKPVPPDVLRAKARVYLQLQERSARLERLGERQGELLAMLGHELRNPLAAMVSALDIIKLRDPHYGREVAVLDRQVAHLTHLVGDLVDVARITQGRISLRRETVAVADVLRDALDTLRPVLDAHDVSLQVGDDVMVDADRHRLTQVVTNLLSNAAKYTPAPGRIEIRAEAQDAFVSIAVRDNGRGIAPALLPCLFDLFVQGERAPDRREGGLGIGLTLVRRIVELHGGSVEATSDGPGTGATFTVRLPRAASATATATGPAAARPTVPAPLRILIVDDNNDAAEMLAAVVGSLGHHVAVANDGETALELARQFSPHVALLDIGLPEIDGYELAIRLRSLPRCAATVLIAVTGYGQPEDRERANQAGFKHHLVKPVELQTLRELLAIDE